MTEPTGRDRYKNPPRLPEGEVDLSGWLPGPAGTPQGDIELEIGPGRGGFILERAKVPVVVDAGVGTASDVAIAFELGAHGVLMNTGVALARDPVRMARAMRAAALAGRDAFLAGRIGKRLYAQASSPTQGVIAGE